MVYISICITKKALKGVIYIKRAIIILVIIVIGIFIYYISSSASEDEPTYSIQVDDITSSFKDEGVSVSILVEKEQYNQGEIPVIIVSNDGETSVGYQDSGVLWEYFKDDNWKALNINAAGLDQLNVLEPGQKKQVKFAPNSTLQKGLNRAVFIFKVNKNEEHKNKKIAVSFNVD